MHNEEKIPFIGNEIVQNRFERLLQSGNLSHAYLFSGPRHVGKSTYAHQLGRYVLSEDTEKMDEKKIYTVLPRRKTKDSKSPPTIDIESVREIRRSVSLGSDTTRGVCIIEDAHRMTHGAQNALLKYLEEPKTRMLFFLITDRPGEILSTIHSRCERIYFSLVGESSMEMLSKESQGGQREKIELSFGRPGLYKEFERDGEIMEHKRILSHLFSTFHKRTMQERILFAQKISSQSEKMSELFEYWVEWKRERCRRGNVDIQKEYKDITLLEEANKLLYQSNANTRLLAESLLLSL